jgi:hypothetical protein
MLSPEAFRSFYDTSLLPVLLTLEAERKMLIGKMTLYMVIAVPLTILALFIHPFLALVPPLAGFIVYQIQFGAKLTEKKHKFKRDVVGKIISGLGENLTYDHTRYIDKSVYQKSKLYLDGISRYKGDDLVSGMVGKTAIRFCELHTQQVRQSGKSTTVVTIFHGLFFIADFNKKFAGETFVLPDLAESTFGSLGKMFQKLNFARPKLVTLEDIEFEKAFAIYSTDQVEARYILSTALMQRILAFKQKTGRQISISFIDSNVYIGIPINKELFETSLFTSLLNYNQVAEYYNYLALCVGIVEALDLNTRIWTKE